MRTVSFALLSAAVTSVTGAYALPTDAAAPIAQRLPAKFSLTYVPLQKGPLPVAGGTIVAEEAYDMDLWANMPSNRPRTLVIFNSNSTSGFSSASVSHADLGWIPGFEWNAHWFVSMRKGAPDDVRQALPSTVSGSIHTTGLGVVNGGLTWDLTDGKGPQSLWTLCERNKDWNLAWAKTDSTCVAVELKVHVL